MLEDDFCLNVSLKDVILLHKNNKARSVRNTRKTAPRRRRSNPANKRTLKWLLLFFPVGVTMMWKSACTWRRGVKFAVTGAMVAIICGVFLLPAAPEAQGGIRLVGAKPEAEVYGPELPASIVPGYTKKATGSVLVEVKEDEDIEYVYAADGAECYHDYKCKFAYASSQRLTVYEAYFLGFEPCGRCNPPKYTG